MRIKLIVQAMKMLTVPVLLAGLTLGPAAAAMADTTPGGGAPAPAAKESPKPTPSAKPKMIKADPTPKPTAKPKSIVVN
ncbi:MAG TPA: hypothetical protein VHV82_15770 [Sporichthyaceae bacterium]|jgi:hypothetical protein|nr:hypothetical protein [Sporichthyaceae bacterium]